MRAVSRRQNAARRQCAGIALTIMATSMSPGPDKREDRMGGSCHEIMGSDIVSDGGWMDVVRLKNVM